MNQTLTNPRKRQETHNDDGLNNVATASLSQAAHALSLVRAVRLDDLSLRKDEISERVASALDRRRKNALDQSDGEPQHRAAELTLCAAGLAELRTPDHRKIEMALKDALAARPGETEPIAAGDHVSAFEVADAACRIAQALLDDSFNPRQTLPQHTIEALVATVDQADDK